MRTLSSLALVDLNSILVRIYKGAPKDAEPGYVETATLGELALIRQSCEHTIICLDRPPYFRKGLYPGYKGSREPDETLNQIKRHVRKTLDLQGYVVAQAEGFEADDLLATGAKAYYDVCPDIRLISSDKDIAQCLNDRVRGFDAKTGDLRDEHWCYRKFGVEPKNMALFQALTGDDSDEFKGIPSWGPKTAAAKIAEGGDLAGIRRLLAKAIDNSAHGLDSRWVKFAEHQGDLETYLALATLRTDAPLDIEALLDPKGKHFDAASVTDAFAASMQKTTDQFLEAAMLGTAPAPEDLKEEKAVMAAEDWIGGEDPDSEPQELAPMKRAIEQAATEDRKAIAEGKINHLGKETPEGPRATLPPKQQAMYELAMEEQRLRDSVTGTPIFGKLISGEQANAIMTRNQKGLELLRKTFPEHQVGKLPKPTKSQTEAPAAEKRNCGICGSWHHPKVVHLDYVGHAVVTDRLLEADPSWYWEPLAFDEKGIPRFDATGGMWIRLTVCGVSRLGYGSAATSNFKEVGSREKEVISDAIRNAAMRFGVALQLWSKQELNVTVDP